jgi:predicted transcriptional regulator
MGFELTREIEAIVEEFIDFEGYNNRVDVLRDALKALKRELDISGIKEGIEDMNAGRYRPAREVFEEIRKKFGFGKE